MPAPPKHVPQMTLPQAVAGLRKGLQAMDFADPNFRESALMQLDDQLQWLPDARKEPPKLGRVNRLNRMIPNRKRTD